MKKIEQRSSAKGFRMWLDEMKALGLAKSDIGCGRLLGRTGDSICEYKKHGAPRSIALACAALTRNIRPIP